MKNKHPAHPRHANEGEDRPIELRKAHEAVFILPAEGHRLPLVMRKVYNVLLKHAQDQGVNVDEYRMPIGALVECLAYDSNDYDLLKDYLRKLQGTQVEWDVLNESGKKKWGVTSLLARVEIDDGVIRFSFENKLKSSLLDPSIYYRLDLRLQSLFRSSFALVLYETCGRYATNPSGVTAKMHWTMWRSLICGEETRSHEEFKYFNARVLKRAVSEVNAVSDITLEPLVFREGRKVSELQFKVQLKHRQALPPVDDSSAGDLYQRMLNVGVPSKQARSLLNEFGADRVEAALGLVGSRVSNTKLAPLSSVAAYFISSLRNGFDSQPNKKKQKDTGSDASVLKQKILDAFNARRIQDACEYYNEMPPAQQEEFRANFVAEMEIAGNPAAKWLSSTGAKAKAALSTFYGWLAKKTWGTPTEAEVFDFALESGLIKDK